MLKAVNLLSAQYSKSELCLDSIFLDNKGLPDMLRFLYVVCNAKNKNKFLKTPSTGSFFQFHDNFSWYFGNELVVHHVQFCCMDILAMIILC